MHQGIAWSFAVLLEVLIPSLARHVKVGIQFAFYAICWLLFEVSNPCQDPKAVVSELFDVEYVRINESQHVQVSCFDNAQYALLSTPSCLLKELERTVEKFSEILENNLDRSGGLQPGLA